MILRSFSRMPTFINRSTTFFTAHAERAAVLDAFKFKRVLHVLSSFSASASSPFTSFGTTCTSARVKMNESVPCSRNLGTDPVNIVNKVCGTTTSMTSSTSTFSTSSTSRHTSTTSTRPTAACAMAQDVNSATAAELISPVTAVPVGDTKMDAEPNEDKSSAVRMHLKRKHSPARTKKGKKLDKHPKKIAKFAIDERFDETSYYFENGLRKVKPYVYVFETHVKGRWMGRSILDVFKTEFRMESPEYYQMAINRGLITIDGQRVTLDKVLVNNEFLRSMVHRHEPPVTGEPLDIITVDDEFVVLNKPASIPVHPCGKYRHNSIIFLLGKDHGLTGLHTIHRLDRLTSGLLMFARTREVSQRLDAYVRDRKLTKVYVCKVQGEFPSEPLECTQPIYTMSHKIGVCRVSPEGKQCRTAFKRLSYDGQTSIVQCTPHTGRMHQIRVHLQYLGYPIVNDPLYNNSVWGPQIGKGGNMPHTSDNDLLTALIEQHTIELKSQILEDPCDFVEVNRSRLVPVSETPNGVDSANEATKSSENCLVNIQNEMTNEAKSHAEESEYCSKNENTNSQIGVEMSDYKPGIGKHGELGEGSHDQLGSSEQKLKDDLLPGSRQDEDHPLEMKDDKELHELVKSVCRECRLKLRDPTPDEMIMYLHALSYKGPGFEFSTPLPKWAEEHIQK